jgi:hypothetical protein
MGVMPGDRLGVPATVAIGPDQWSDGAPRVEPAAGRRVVRVCRFGIDDRRALPGTARPGMRRMENATGRSDDMIRTPGTV